MTSPGAPGQVEGVVERVVFVDRGGCTVVLLDGGDVEPVRAAGTVLAGVQAGESLRLSGMWTWHPTGGRQFTVADCAHALSATALARRLGSLLAGEAVFRCPLGGADGRVTLH